METSDEALLGRVAGRDERAFDLLVGRHQGRAYRLAWSLLRDADEARDLAQEAFLRVWERAPSFRGGARFSTWLYRIVVHLCLDHRRRRRAWGWLGDGRDAAHADPEAPGTGEPAAPFEDPAEALGRGQVMDRLWAAVDRLPPRQRAAIVLSVQEGLPTPDIAAVLECSEATVRVHLHRAVQTLRRLVDRP